ncbi:hypothetical protein KC334_g62 [Hortaea werneckii]|nr:hypothetical protein KC334_g62 [Hortaea werneckii]
MAVVTMVPVRSWSGCSCRCGCRKCVRQRKDIKDIRGLLGVAEDATELIAAVESGVEERTTDLSLPRHLQHFTRVARPLPISRTTSPREGKRVERCGKTLSKAKPAKQQPAKQPPTLPSIANAKQP